MADEPEFLTGATDSPEPLPATPGAKLRAAREAQGLSLHDVATRTRIAQRQLEAIERDDYAALPGIPYAIGFARAYARAIGFDEVAIAADVRRAVNNSDLGTARYEAFEPADPARVPSRTLAWTAAAIAILVIAGFVLWRTQILTAPTGEEIARQADQPVATPRPAATLPVEAQPVIFTAIDDVWLRIYDEAGERLKDGLLKKGESFTLPAGARNPMILTGRPQAVAITVGGRAIPSLGPADRTIADVPVNAAALLARTAPAPAPSGTSVSPVAGSAGGSAMEPALRGRPVTPSAASQPAAPSPSAEPAAQPSAPAANATPAD
ncbi:helix-turn-helix domain-containing protein [Sphingobium sp. AN558]|uniref:helix-turn-helix domain-containing protein n=1 Tax=Sphingobium sp. AN558 TaxID=3133442 RepID=UPI0030BA51DD